MKIGSLFDGSGMFPFAATLCGGRAVWASEINPYPIAVTRQRFPGMRHLGNITEIKGSEIEPVDVITFGSPCQDLSVAGKRAGLDGERSGLFREAVRIIKEMRHETITRADHNGGVGGQSRAGFPRFAVWENVFGALSSHGGEDFRVVLEELARIADPTAVIPRPPQGKWRNCGCIVGDGYSVAWRVVDAQYWGVPQRRRRIYLVADFDDPDDGTAGKICAERDGLSRSFAAIKGAWKGLARNAGHSVDGANRVVSCFSKGVIGFNHKQGSKARSIAAGIERSCTLRGSQQGASICCEIVGVDGANRVVFCFQKGTRPNEKNGAQGYKRCEVAGTMGTFRDKELIVESVFDARGNGSGTVCPTLTGDHENRITDYTAVAVVGVDCYNQQATGGKAKTLRAGNSDSDVVPCVVYPEIARALAARHDGSPCVDRGQNAVCYAIDPLASHSMQSDDPYSGSRATEIARCLDTKGGDPRRNQGGNLIMSQIYAMDRAANNQGEHAQYDFDVRDDGKAQTIVARGPCAVCYGVGNGQTDQTKLDRERVGALDCMHDQKAVLMTVTMQGSSGTGNGGITLEDKSVPVLSNPHDTYVFDPSFLARLGARYIVRRLTPAECCRLQGAPDGWGDVLPIGNMTDEEAEFWRGVYATWQTVRGKKVSPSIMQDNKRLISWHNGLHTDSAEYEMWGNGIALPCALYFMEGIAEALSESEAKQERTETIFPGGVE